VHSRVVKRPRGVATKHSHVPHNPVLNSHSTDSLAPHSRHERHRRRRADNQSTARNGQEPPFRAPTLRPRVCLSVCTLSRGSTVTVGPGSSCQ
jgi:hypothetical protein